MDDIHAQTKKALSQYQTVKELLSLMDDLEKALQKSDHHEIGRVQFEIRSRLILLFRGLGGRI
jgi:hypothetical protein